MARIRYLRPALRVFAIGTLLYFAYRYYSEEKARVPPNENSPFNELTVYVSVLENESQKNHTPLACSPTIEETFHFKDQWGHPLLCTSDEKHLYIKSSGPDGIPANEDDLILRRRVEMKNQ